MWDKIEAIIDFAAELNDWADSSMVVEDIGVIIAAQNDIKNALARIRVELNNRELNKMIKEVMDEI